MWNDLSFDTFPIFPYRNIPQITAQRGSADNSHCLLKVRAPSAGIPMAEQHLPGFCAWAGDGNGTCWERLHPSMRDSEPLDLWITPAQTLEPEQTAGHPFHVAQNASQPCGTKCIPNKSKFRFFAVEEWKAISHDWKQEALQIPGVEHIQLVSPGN